MTTALMLGVKIAGAKQIPRLWLYAHKHVCVRASVRACARACVIVLAT